MYFICTVLQLWVVKNSDFLEFLSKKWLSLLLHFIILYILKIFVPWFFKVGSLKSVMDTTVKNNSVYMYKCHELSLACGTIKRNRGPGI